MENNLIQITKDEIAALPVVEYQGRIVTIQTEEDANKAIEYLSTFSILGFDTETKPAFKKGVINKVALLQLSTEDTCFLFRLNMIGMPGSLSALLADEKVLKVGLSLKDDFAQLNRLAGITPKGFIELQSFVKPFGIADNSLQKIFAILFKQKISKKQRLTNWAADILTDAQKKYASLDAWACLQIYLKLIVHLN